MSATEPASGDTSKNAGGIRDRGARHRGWLPLWILLIVAAAGVGVAILLSSEPTGPPETIFPLPERYADSYTNDWGASRVQGSHEGTDVFAPRGTPIRSITDGSVSTAFGSSGNGWNTLGGYTVMIEAAQDVGPIERGDRIYYAHMNGPTPLEPGDKVEAGQKIGEVGDTGQGPEGTRGKFEPHLHLGWYSRWSLFESDRSRVSSGAMNPYPLLRWIRKRETVSLHPDR